MNVLFYESIDRLPLGVAVTVEFLGPLAVAVIASRRKLDLVWIVLAGVGVALLADGAGKGVHPFGLALAAIVLDARGGEIQTTPNIRKASAAMRQALKISNDDSDMLEGALSFGHLLQDTPPSVATLKRFLATPTAADARSLMRAAARVGILSPRVENLLQALADLEKSEYAPMPFVTGDDLTAAGLKPGPLFKKVLDAVYDAQLEARVTNKPAAMELALTIAKQ
jgi:hypothetical protein